MSSKQYLSDEVPIEYGIKKTWRIALVAPDGEILSSKGLGHSSSPAASIVAYHAIREFLPTTNWACKDLLCMDVGQMLELSRLRSWHCYRLAWGDRDPLDRDSVYPNGIDRTWTLYFCSNGSNKVLLTGELPEHWWDWSVDDRYHYIQNL